VTAPRIHDITVPVQAGMVVYPGNPAVSLERVQSLRSGDHCNVSRLALGVHTGTHVDLRCTSSTAPKPSRSSRSTS
jgi:kynurenine formamidase